MSSSIPGPIAIVGIAAELPSGHWSKSNLDINNFFEFLLEKGEAYEEIPRERFNITGLHGQGLGQVITNTGTFLKDVQFFDYLEFGITSKDARLMALSTRKLIETSFLSLVDSGIEYRGKNVGCYVSGVAHDVFSVSGYDETAVRGSFAFGPSMLANRVSYHLDLRGPSIAIDTACSSSLHATHLAVQALRNGDCDAAVVGGCQINHRFAEWALYTQGGVLSPDGKCKVFDAAADGFSRGEGVVCIVLKPLNAAICDGDKVYATILGIGVNSCGALAPVNAPVASAQRDAMQRAFRQAQRNPKDVDFVELHATGTAQGDPTEANWVGTEFARDDEILIGSVKGNVGHLEITSFLASLCKVCSMLQTGLIPPNVNFVASNPRILWEKYQLRVPTEVEHLSCHNQSGRPLVAMSSSAIGGANGHCVVEGPAPVVIPAHSQFWRDGDAKIPILLVAGGLSPRSVSDIETSLTDFTVGALNTQHSLQALSHIYGRRSRSMTWRSFALATEAWVSPFSASHLVPKVTPTLVFVFSGQGPQFYEMGRDLFFRCAAFRRSVVQMDKIYQAVRGVSLIESTGLFAGKPEVSPLKLDTADIWPIDITLPALTILQIALVDTLATLGIKPDAVLGHSAGETAMAYASGSGDRALAVELAIARGEAMSTLQDAGGTMAALSCSPEQACHIIAEVKAKLGEAPLEIGCFNAADAVTLSGMKEHIDHAVQIAEASGIFARRLRTRTPIHSSMMDLCQAQYQHMVGNVFTRHILGTPRVETYSTLTGKAHSVAFDSSYFWNSTRGPVQFAGATQSLMQQHPDVTFIEIGPRPVLASYLTSIAGHKTSVLCPLRNPRNDETDVESLSFTEMLGKLVVAGHNNIDFGVLCGQNRAFDGQLPQFPFAKKDVPFLSESLTSEGARLRQHRNGPLNYPQLRLSSKTHPDLADHVIEGEIIMPASGYIEMALEFGAKILRNIEFISIMPIFSERATPVEVSRNGHLWYVHSASATSMQWPSQFDRLHARGVLDSAWSDGDPPCIDITQIRDRLEPVVMTGFYDEFSHFANYGPTYQRIIELSRGYDPLGHEEFLVKLRGADDDLMDTMNYVLHPAILDAAIHALVHPQLTGSKDKYYLPSRVLTFTSYRQMSERPLPQTMYTHATLREWTPTTILYDLSVTDDSGRPLCSFEGLEVTIHGISMDEVSNRYEVVRYELGISVAAARDGQRVPDPTFEPETQTIISSWSRQSRRGRLCGLTEKDGSQSAMNEVVAGTECSPLYTTSESDSSNELDSAYRGSGCLRIVNYSRGREMILQQIITDLDPMAAESVWFVTTSNGIDDGASLGFVRSLRKEYLSWDMRLVIFDSSWTNVGRERAIGLLSSFPECELELEIDAGGSAFAHRVIISPPPVLRAAFQPNLPWVSEADRTEVTQISLPFVPDDHVLVHVLGISPGPGDIWAFIGRTDDSRLGDSLVTSLTTGPLSNIVVAHTGSLVPIPTTPYGFEEPNGLVGPCVLASTIAVLAVGLASFCNPERLRHTPIIVPTSQLGHQIIQIFAGLSSEVHVLSITASISINDIPHAAARYPAIVISAGCDDAEPEALTGLGHVRRFQWGNPNSGVAHILATDPWSIGDALRCTINQRDRPTERYKAPLDCLGQPLPTLVPVTDVLFDSTKSYVLIGGVGSLGLHIAKWMYLRGARKIIMTSRTGRVSLLKRNEFVSLRLLRYLEELPDLALRVESVDALSIPDMTELLSTIRGPIGGCMLLSMILKDNMFASQSSETFEAVFRPKVDAFRTLEATVSIESLDFLITFSSIAGLFGNPGQTNYSSANTALAGLTRKYRNAFVFVCPVVTDTGAAFVMDAMRSHRIRHLADWGMTSGQICQYLEDGIRKLRKAAIWQYVPDFDWSLVRSSMGSSAMYDHLIPSTCPSHHPPDSSDTSLSAIVCKILDIDQADLAPNVPLTTYGLDSLSAASLSYALRPFMAISQIQLLAGVTLDALQARSSGASNGKQLDGVETRDEDVDAREIYDRVQDMLRLVTLHSSEITPRPSPHSQKSSSNTPQTVLLTGSTGSLGSHTLAHLLRSSTVLKVFAILRKDLGGCSAMQRQVLAFQSRGLDHELLKSEKLTLFEGNLVDPALGLAQSAYKELADTLSHIIHLAWSVDFGAPLLSFENPIRGLKNLVGLAASASSDRPTMRLLFSSTAGVFRKLQSGEEGEETPIIDPLVAVGSGYSESKWVAERILILAAEKRVVNPTVIRIGQLTGGHNGNWKTSEWVPSLASASYALGCVPDGIGTVSWLPVDTAAGILLEMMDSTEPILHLRHPQPVPWSEIMSQMALLLDVPMVPYREWYSRLEQRATQTSYPDGVQRHLAPGLRLLEFFRNAYNATIHNGRILDNNGLSWSIAITKGRAVSPSLRNSRLTKLGADEARKWIDYWRSVDFLPNESASRE